MDRKPQTWRVSLADTALTRMDPESRGHADTFVPRWRRRALTPTAEGATMLVARDLTAYITRKD